jgi:cell division protein FtsW (lipid II flippase)
MERIVNLRLLSHPVNWLVVWTVLILAGMGFMLIHEAATDTGVSTDTDNA